MLYNENLIIAANITKRETFKDRNVLCKRLGVNVPSGKDGINRFNEFLDIYYIFKYHKNSHAITLTPRKKLLSKPPRKSTANNDKYCTNGVDLLSSYLPESTKNLVSEDTGFFFHIRKKELMKEIGLCNKHYVTYDNKDLTRERAGATRLDEIHLSNVLDAKGAEVLTNVLNRMVSEKKIISFRTTYLVKDTEDGAPRPPTHDEIKLIDKIESGFLEVFRAKNKGILKITNKYNEFFRAQNIMFHRISEKHLVNIVYRIEVSEQAILSMSKNRKIKSEREQMLLSNNAHILEYLEKVINDAFDKAAKDNELFEKNKDCAHYNYNLEDTNSYEKLTGSLKIPTDHKQVQMALIDELVRLPI